MKKISVIVKECYENALEKLLYTDGSQIRNHIIKEFDSFVIEPRLCILSRKCARAWGYPFNVNICGTDFYGTIIIAGLNGGELTDVLLSIDELKNTFPDLFPEE